MESLDASDIIEELRKRLKPYDAAGKRFLTLPSEGMSGDEIINLLMSYSKEENKAWREGRVSGAVYHGGDELTSFLESVYSLYSQTNPLHPDVWPSLIKFENEIVSMSSSIMHGNESVRGSVTSGGTESLLLAMKTYRDYYRHTKGITDPEVILPTSAHPAFLKACDYFGIKHVFVELDDKFRADVEKVKQAINKNTIAIVGSAPSFPHGAIDPIEELSEIALDHGIGMHVDSCLGGFILPWAERLGYRTGKFDFSLPGVTSISMDTHKYGYAPKGTSVLLYRSSELFQHQLYTNAKWQGGIYFTPTMQGSRPGYPIVAAWAVMLLLGERGYMESARRILETGKYTKDGVKEIEGIRILGEPLYVIAVSSELIDPYQIMGSMEGRGWLLNGLANPAGFHIALTMRHTYPGVMECFLRDLRSSVEEAKKLRTHSGGLAPIYGIASLLPEEQVNFFLKNIVEWLYSS